MRISEVRVVLSGNRRNKLKAFCSVTFDDSFVIRDLKVIEGANGIFVAMPSRKLTDRCPRCLYKNHLRANYCNDCGNELDTRCERMRRARLFADIAHPINSSCRQMIQKAVNNAYANEVEASRSPGYIPLEYELFDEGDIDFIIDKEDDSQGTNADQADSFSDDIL